VWLGPNSGNAISCAGVKVPSCDQKEAHVSKEEKATLDGPAQKGNQENQSQEEALIGSVADRPDRMCMQRIRHER
jgi:hypothetical protein